MPDDVKKKYEALAGKTLTDTQLVDNLGNRLKEVEAELSKFVSSVTKSINRLDEIALRPTNTSCSAYIDVLIANEERDKTPGYDGRIKTLQKFQDQAKLTGFLFKRYRSDEPLL